MISKQIDSLNSKILPLDTKPKIMGFNHHAYYLGILFTYDKFEPYFYNDYINIASTKDINDLWCNFIVEKQYTEKNHFLNCYLVESSQLLSNFNFINDKIMLNSLIVDMINKGFYVLGNFNEYYIPNRRAYNKYYFEHDYLLYGFDIENEYYNLIGYDHNMNYSGSAVSFDQFYNAINTFENGNYITFVKVNEKFNFTINLQKIIRYINDYINSQNTDNSYHDCIYGIDVMKKVILYLTQKDDKKKGFININMIFFKNLLDHKSSMYDRVLYLYNNNYLKNEKIIEYSKKVKDLMGIVFNLVIKFNTTNDYKLIQRMTSYFSEMIELEKYYMKTIAVQLNHEMSFLEE